MSNDKMSPEMQIAIRRSPDYTAPSAEVLDLQVRLEAANKVALSALERAKKLQAEVDRMAPEFEAILAVNDGLRAEVAAKDAAYLGGAPTEAEALQMRLDAAEAEVAAWRRAVRWRETSYSVNGATPKTLWGLCLHATDPVVSLGVVAHGSNGWWATANGADEFGLADRNTACVKACELLGIPTVLPGGE